MDAENEPLLFVSANKNKLQYANKLLHNLAVDVKCVEFKLYDALYINDIFLVAAFKATEAYDRSRKPCIVMDTGFYINNYPGEREFPGSLINENLLIPLGVDGLLEKMKDIKDRSCFFKECLVYYDGSHLQTFYGYRFGNLLTEKRGSSTVEAWSELWSVFEPRNSHKTLAEMTEEERHDKKDGHSEALEEFAAWYRQKNPQKVLKKQ